MEAAALNLERRRIKPGGARSRAAAAQIVEKMIPAFGEWDLVQNDNVPITQYFECCGARHPYSPTPPASYPLYYSAVASGGFFDAADTLFLHSTFPPRHDDNFHGLYYCPSARPPPPFSMGSGRREVVKGECGARRRRRRQLRSCLENRNRVFDVTQTTETVTTYESPNDVVSVSHLADLDKVHAHVTTKNNVKAKDEDLYKIPPELLLRDSKPVKKKMSKFFGRCFVTICASF